MRTYFQDLVSLKPMTRTFTSDFTLMSLNGRVPCRRNNVLKLIMEIRLAPVLGVGGIY